MTDPDLTNLTADELRRIAIGDGTTADDPYAAVDELHRRAQANALVQAERDEFDEELHTCRAIVGATSEHLHVDLEELVDKLRRTEADSRSWQELATARAQANDALLSTLSDWCVRRGADLCPTAGSADSFGEGMRAAKERVRRMLDAAAPAAPPTPAAPVTDADTLQAQLDFARTEIGGLMARVAKVEEERGELRAELAKLSAPVTDAEIEAAIKSLEAHVASYQWSTTLGGLLEVNKRRSELVALIARRVASAGAAPVDSEREAAIDQAIRHHWNCARSHARGDTSPQCVEDCLKADERLRALMRSAPPQGRGDDGMRLVGLDLFSLRDSLAADRPAPVDSERWRQLAEVKQVRIDRLKDDLHAAQGEVDKLRAALMRSAVPTPVDSEREAAIEAWRVKAWGAKENGAWVISKTLIDEAVRLMRSAPAGDQDAKLRELLSWADGWSRSDKHGPEWRTAFECVAGQVRFLLGGNAADALSASAIAAAPEAPKREPWEERWNDAETGSREELLAMRDGLLSHARRIEALERANNKEEVK